MTRVRLLPEAEEELLEAILFYEDLRHGLGQALVIEVRRAAKRIAERPMASGVVSGEVRVRSVLRFPYLMYYRVRGEEIVVIAIAHRRRKPGFWHARVRRGE